MIPPSRPGRFEPFSRGASKCRQIELGHLKEWTGKDVAPPAALRGDGSGVAETGCRSLTPRP